MSDPLLLVAAGAAVGGLASKVTEKAWDSAERWIRERFSSHAEKARNTARQNAAEFVRCLAMHVLELDNQHVLQESAVQIAQEHPHFSAFLQKTILNAANTDNNDKHDALARLVAMRLAAESESTLALASEMASDAITRSNRRQIEMMALCCFLYEIRPRDPLPTVVEYYRWLDVQLRLFDGYEFIEIDARHLVAVGCASYDPVSERELAGVLLLKAGAHLVRELFNDDFVHIPSVEILKISWDMGLSGVQLTSVGSIVGGIALSQMKGFDCGSPSWQ